MARATRTSTTRPDGALAALLAPTAVDEFVLSHWRTRPLLCRGQADRFEELLSWSTLNELLEHHWRETYRFRLAVRGRDLDPARYADLTGFTPRVRAADVTEHLRLGATLSFDAIDELHEPLTRLAESVEGFFRGATKINAYAGWRRGVHGLDLHRDDQEIFILHLYGRKRWLLYGSSIDGIDRSGLAAGSTPPAGADFDDVLEPGDLLYLPRGCYHIAIPVEEPVLHLTMSVRNPRGVDLLRWAADRGREDLGDTDVPTLGPGDARLEYSDRVRDALGGRFERDLVEQYLRESGSNLKPRPSFSLPWSATAEGLPPGDDFSVRLTAGNLTIVDAADAPAVDIRCGGRVYRLPRAVRAIVERLDGGAPQPFGELLDALSPPHDANTIRILLGMLVKHALIAVRE